MLNKIIGTILIIAAFVVEASWLGVCFGSVIVGIVLLIFAPGILFAPFNILFTMGLAFFARDSISNANDYSYSYRSYSSDRSSGGYSYYSYGQQNSTPFDSYDTGMKKYYDTLGCKPDDDFETVKKAYRKLSREFHPDSIEGKGLGDEFVEYATRRMQEINEAYAKIKEARGQ